MAGNLERILPEGMHVQIDRSQWQVPVVFDWIQKLGQVDREEMFRVFNMGVGFTLVVRPRAVDEIIERVVSFGLEIYRLGTVVEGERKVELVG